MDWDHLGYLKERCRTEHKKFEQLELGSDAFALMPYGRKPFTYVLANRDYEIRLAEHLRPSAHVQFYSEALWTKGLASLLTQFSGGAIRCVYSGCSQR